MKPHKLISNNSAAEYYHKFGHLLARGLGTMAADLERAGTTMNQFYHTCSHFIGYSCSLRSGLAVSPHRVQEINSRCD